MRRLAILGMGVSGISALKLAVKKGFDVVAINTGEPETWANKSIVQSIIAPNQCLNENRVCNEVVSGLELLIVSPGVADDNPVVELANTLHIPMVSEIEFAYQYCETPIIAITGTNGKTTTTTMVSELLELAGLKVFTGGNIGTAFCEMFLDDKKYDWCLLEISSFQLEKCIKFRPNIATILNLSENHMERYTKLEDYGLAKLRIFMNQTEQDVAIIPTNLPFKEKGSYPKVKVEWNESELQSFVKSFNFSKSRLIGDHNKQNFYVTYLIGKSVGIKNLDQVMQKLIDEFKGVHHRIEYVGEWGRLRFYNDAKSTNTLATITALESFKDTTDDVYLIMGGKTRDGKEDHLRDLDDVLKRVKKVFLIGENAMRLEVALKKVADVEVSGQLENALKSIEANGFKGNVLFSPGYPSFDQFNNYAHRGEVYKEIVKKLFARKIST